MYNFLRPHSPHFSCLCCPSGYRKKALDTKRGLPSFCVWCRECICLGNGANVLQFSLRLLKRHLWLRHGICRGPVGRIFPRHPNGYRPQSHETRDLCFGFGSGAPFVFWFLFGFGKTTLVCFGFGSGCIFQKCIKIAKITECESVFGPKVL